MGGGLFVAGPNIANGTAVTSGGAATLNGVVFRNDAAIGGKGGRENYTFFVAYPGGGGGMGINGGYGAPQSVFSPYFRNLGGSAAAGGGIGSGADGGIIPGAPNGGGLGSYGGSGGHYYGRGGGVGASGSIGGFGGGGGASGGEGGFGGGGAGGSPAGDGGFGGGGGAGGGAQSGTGGYGAGNGNGQAYGGGGGGLGAGGDVFVQSGGRLTIQGGTLATGTATGGAGGAFLAGSGKGLGGTMFIDGTQAVTLAPTVGQTLMLHGAIADEAGASTLVVAGAGNVELAQDASYGGTIEVSGGTLIVDAPPGSLTGPLIDDGTTVLRVPSSPGHVVSTAAQTMFPGDNIYVESNNPYFSGVSVGGTGSVLDLYHSLVAAQFDYPDIALSYDATTGQITFSTKDGVPLYLANTAGTPLDALGIDNQYGGQPGQAYYGSGTVTTQFAYPIQGTDSFVINGTVVRPGFTSLTGVANAINAAAIAGVTASIDPTTHLLHIDFDRGRAAARRFDRNAAGGTGNRSRTARHRVEQHLFRHRHDPRRCAEFRVPNPDDQYRLDRHDNGPGRERACLAKRYDVDRRRCGELWLAAVSAVVSRGIRRCHLGLGGVTDQNGSSLTLTGSSDFTGGMTVSGAGSTLSIASDANLGAPASPISLQNATTLHFTSGFGFDHAVSVAGDPVFDVDPGQTVSVTVPIGDGASPGDVVLDRRRHADAGRRQYVLWRNDHRGRRSDDGCRQRAAGGQRGRAEWRDARSGQYRSNGRRSVGQRWHDRVGRGHAGRGHGRLHQLRRPDHGCWRIDQQGTGVLALTGPNSFAGGIVLQSGTLEIGGDGSVGSGTIAFGSAAPTLRIDGPTMPANVISRFHMGDTIDLAGIVYNANDTTQYAVGTGELDILNDTGTVASLFFGPGNARVNDPFHLAQEDGGTGIVITNDVACFCPGTRILTDRGEVKVEEYGPATLRSPSPARIGRSAGSAGGGWTAPDTGIPPARRRSGFARTRSPTACRAGTCSFRRTTRWSSKACWSPRSNWSMAAALFASTIGGWSRTTTWSSKRMTF